MERPQLRPDRVVELRQALGKSRHRLSEEIGISYPSMRDLELGATRSVDAWVVALLAAALDTTMDYLLGLTDDPQPRRPTPRLPIDEALRRVLLLRPDERAALVHWKDEEYLKQLSVASRRGQQVLVRMGYIPAGGPPPYGYRVESEEREIGGKRRTLRRWVLDPITSPIARRAWEMRLAGATMAMIHAELHIYRHESTLSSLFSNPAYKGSLPFGGTIIPVPAIVTPEEWQRVQDMRQQHGPSYPRRQGSDYLLSGLLTCARCGASLVAGHSPGGQRNDGHVRREWRYYVCSGRVNRRDCDLPYLPATKLEAAVVTHLRDVMLTDEAIDARVAALAERMESDRPLIEVRADSLRTEVRELEKRIARLLDALETGDDSEAVRARIREREGELATVRRQLAEAEVSAQSSAADLAAQLRSLRSRLTDELLHGPAGRARDLLSGLIETVIVDQENAIIRFRSPF